MMRENRVPAGSTLDEEQVVSVFSGEPNENEKMENQPMLLGYNCDDDDPEDDDQSN